MKPLPTSLPNKEDLNRDLGFGAVVARESRRRLLNRDGSFNVARTGLSWWASLNLYHWLLTISWRKFLGLLALAYLAINVIFATAYTLCGPDALIISTGDDIHNAFLRAFFFSVQTFATIGYGHISPAGPAANVIVTTESFFGLFAFALATGLLFSRFSRPTAQIIFSQSALIAPYHEITAFMFRIANARTNQIIELEAKVLFARFEEEEGRKVRRFYPLHLERDKVTFFPLSWTIVHPINESSPLYGLRGADFKQVGAEFLILLTGIDETFSQTVHTRSSYGTEDLVCNARFVSDFNLPTSNDMLGIDIRRLHMIERLDTVSASSAQSSQASNP
jgi:inward rectifier potassium channel